MQPKLMSIVLREGTFSLSEAPAYPLAPVAVALRCAPRLTGPRAEFSFRLGASQVKTSFK